MLTQRLTDAAYEVDERTPDDRDRYADLLRVAAILIVVYGHWTVAVIVVDDGRVLATQLLAVEPWTRFATWVAQVMPLFFLVGGRVNAGSLARATERGRSASWWVRRRCRRLLRPMLPLLVLWFALTPLLDRLGVDGRLIERAGEVAVMPLWFLVVYLLVIVLAPMTIRLHRRAGWWVVVAGVPLVLIVDLADLATIPLVAETNHLLVFGIAHQLGYLWADERVPSGPRALHLTWLGLGVAIALVAVFDYPLSMVGLEATAASNATPPTLALLALGIAQFGIVLAAREPVTRWLQTRVVVWAAVAGVGSVIITVFLWHMSALLVVTSLTHLAGWWPTVDAIGATWWLLRIPWLALCTVALVPLVLVFRRLEAGGEPPPGRGWTTLLGVLASAVGLYLVLTEGVWSADRALGVPPVAIALLLTGARLTGVVRSRPSRSEVDEVG